MDTVKAFFGVAFLGVAAWMLDRLLTPSLMMGVWALVALAALVVTWTIGLPDGRRTPLRWVGGTVAGIVALLLAISGVTGGTDPLHPWQGSRLLGLSNNRPTLSFTPIHTGKELDEALTQAATHQVPVLVDFYADWCVSCKEMQARTFSDPQVQQALAHYRLITIDVTANSAEDQVLLKRFGLFGPPATLFFGSDGREKLNARLVGFMNANDFTAHLAQIAP
jgi:thiol:disulfide interchange protein DsbD